MVVTVDWAAGEVMDVDVVVVETMDSIVVPPSSNSVVGGVVVLVTMASVGFELKDFIVVASSSTPVVEGIDKISSMASVIVLVKSCLIVVALEAVELEINSTVEVLVLSMAVELLAVPSVVGRVTSASYAISFILSVVATSSNSRNFKVVVGMISVQAKVSFPVVDMDVDMVVVEVIDSIVVPPPSNSIVGRVVVLVTMASVVFELKDFIVVASSSTPVVEGIDKLSSMASVIVSFKSSSVFVVVSETVEVEINSTVEVLVVSMAVELSAVLSVVGRVTSASDVISVNFSVVAAFSNPRDFKVVGGMITVQAKVSFTVVDMSLNISVGTVVVSMVPFDVSVVISVNV